MLSLNDQEWMFYISGFLWPLFRILGLIASAPMLSHGAVPTRVKILLAIFITIIIQPTIPVPKQVDLVSFQGLLIILHQTIIGVAIGYMMRIVFAAIELAGTLSGMTMGLGFASFFDPEAEGQTNAVTQYLAVISLILFLSINGHLQMISGLVESFYWLPIQDGHALGLDMAFLSQWGATIFSAAVQLSLPMVAVLLLTNLALGVLNRAAPQLNLFGIGFPVTICMGFLILALTFQSMSGPLDRLMTSGLTETSKLFTK